MYRCLSVLLHNKPISHIIKLIDDCWFMSSVGFISSCCICDMYSVILWLVKLDVSGFFVGVGGA